METRFIRIDYKNNPAVNAETEEHRQIIVQQAEEGFRYAGFFPVKQGPSGKTIIVDLVFQKGV